ncbi:MAG: hypothetical protein RLZZ401_1573 [Pseudomonadota bacterium]
MACRLPAEVRMPASYSPECCPLCGQANACAMEVEKATGLAQPPCWCMATDFSPELLARVPPEAQRRACICAACAGQALSANARS